MAISAASRQLEPEFRQWYDLIHVLQGKQADPELLKQIIELLGNENNTLEDFLERLLMKLNELIPSELLYIGLVTETAEGLRVVIRDQNRHMIGAVKGTEESLVFDFAIGAQELPEEQRSVTGYVASTKRPERIGDVHKWKVETGFYRVTYSRIRSELAVPILFEDRDVIGVINMESTSADHYTEEDVQQIQWVARLISRPLYAMMNRAGFRRPSLAVLNTIYSDLSALTINADLSTRARKYLSKDSRDVFNSLAERTARALNSENCQIWMLTKDRSQLVLEGEYKPSKKVGSIIKRESDVRSQQAMQQRSLLTLGPSDHSSDEPLLIAPLLASDREYGVIKVTSPTQSPHGGIYYTSGDERMLMIIQQAIAAQIHVKHLEWERRAGALKRREDVNALLDTLTDLSVFAGSEDSVEPILKQTCERIMSLCNAPHCSIFLVDESTGKFVRRASSALPKGFINKKSYKEGEGLTGWVAQNGKPLILKSRRDQDLSQISPRVSWENKGKLHPELLDRPFIAVPILLQGKPIGVIRCTDKTGVQPTFTEADEHILSLMAGNLATAIAFSRRSEGLAKILKSIEQVLAIIKRVGNASEANGFENDLFRQVLSSAKQIFDADVATLHPSNHGQFDTLPMKLGTLRYEKRWCQPPRHDSLIHKLLDSDKDLFFFQKVSAEKILVSPRSSANVETKQRFAIREDIASCVCIRFHTGQLTRGVLFLNYKSRTKFNPRFRELVRAFADLVSLCLEISHLYKDAIEIAEDLHTEIIPQLVRSVLTESGLGCINLRNGDYDQAHTYLINIEAASQRIVCALSDIVRRLITNFTPMDSCIAEGSS